MEQPDTTNSTPDGVTPNPDTPPAEASTLLGGEPAAATEGQDPPAESKPEVKPEDVVPETYEDFAAPEGVTLDTEVTDEFKSLAKEMKLPQKKAQQVADLGVKMLGKWQAQQSEAIASTVAGWAEQSRADKDFGGDKLDENLAVAKRALDQYGSPELMKLLNESGLGNHPEIIRFMYRTGKSLSEDGVVLGKGEGQTNKPRHERMYGQTTP
jgi:hypothetical protein